MKKIHIRATISTTEQASCSDVNGGKKVTITKEKIGRLKFEYDSRAHIGKLPLVSVSVGIGAKTAKGFLAIGNVSIGVFAIGLVAVGGFALGLVSLGIIALACAAAGFISCAGISVGIISVGGVAFGVFALGGFAAGVASVGGIALGAQTAFGGFAAAPVAMGIITNAEVSVSFIDIGHIISGQKAEFETLIREKYPDIWQPFVDWVTMLL